MAFFDRSSRLRQLTGVTVLSAERGQVRLEAASVRFDELFEAHADRVFRMVRRLLGPGAAEADVDDVVQQVFIAAHRSLHRFRGDAQVTTWLGGIAAKKVLMHLRSRRRHRAMLDRLEREGGVPIEADDLHRQVERRQEVRRVWRALMTLSAKKRVVFLLFEVEGHSAPEIADLLNIREGTVRSRLQHARRELMSALNGGDGDA